MDVRVLFLLVALLGAVGLIGAITLGVVSPVYVR